MKNTNKFIDIRNINPTARTQFKYKLGLGRKVLAFGSMALSFIIPDGTAGLIVGVMLLSPISIKHQVKHKAADIKYKIKKRLLMWGLI